MRTICITGGTGFLGRHLIETLKEEPGITLKILARDKSRLKSVPENAKIFEGNLLVRDSMAGFLEPRATVINLAYLSAGTKEENLRAMENLAYCCERAGISRLVHCSTAVVAGSTPDQTVTEESECRPATEYERTKLEIERVLVGRLREKCLVLVLRPTAILGENGLNLVKLTDELMTDPWIIRAIRTSLYGKRKLNLVCVQNVVDAILFLARLDEARSGECFIVSDDEEPDNNYSDVASILSDHLGFYFAKKMGRVPLNNLLLAGILKLAGRSNINPRRIYSCSKLLERGFEKRIPLHTGLAHFASWYKKRTMSL